MAFRKSKIIIGFILFAGIILVGLAVLFNPTKQTIKDGGTTWQRVDDFVYIEPGQTTCFAMSPQCGYCPGKVISRQCYIESNKR